MLKYIAGRALNILYSESRASKAKDDLGDIEPFALISIYHDIKKRNHTAGFV